jgi:hypothetical protein
MRLGVSLPASVAGYLLVTPSKARISGPKVYKPFRGCQNAVEGGYGLLLSELVAASLAVSQSPHHAGEVNNFCRSSQRHSHWRLLVLENLFTPSAKPGSPALPAVDLAGCRVPASSRGGWP